jgi:hypothetical protein
MLRQCVHFPAPVYYRSVGERTKALGAIASTCIFCSSRPLRVAFSSDLTGLTGGLDHAKKLQLWAEAMWKHFLTMSASCIASQQVDFLKLHRSMPPKRIYVAAMAPLKPSN